MSRSTFVEYRVRTALLLFSLKSVQCLKTTILTMIRYFILIIIIIIMLLMLIVSPSFCQLKC